MDNIPYLTSRFAAAFRAAGLAFALIAGTIGIPSGSLAASGLLGQQLAARHAQGDLA